jgi:hypothetical protein
MLARPSIQPPYRHERKFKHLPQPPFGSLGKLLHFLLIDLLDKEGDLLEEAEPDGARVVE